MTIEITRRSQLFAVMVALLMLTGAGCQTFNMSEEDFHRQQNGEVINQDAANAVAVVGTLAAWGIFIGELVAELTKN